MEMQDLGVMEWFFEAHACLGGIKQWVDGYPQYK